jgi:rubrerythrin
MSQKFNADEVFKIGVQIEKNGREFYLAAAAQTVDINLKKMFSELATWETHHATLFENLRSNLPPSIKNDNIYDPDNDIHLYLKSVADNTIFIQGNEMEKVVASCNSALEILQKALIFEKDSVVFYSSMKEIVPADLGKSEIDKLILEELFHVGQLTKEIKKLQ